MHGRFRTAHWLKLTCAYAAVLGLVVVVASLIVTRQLPGRDVPLLMMAFGAAIGTLQYRRDLTLKVSESLTPWALCALLSCAFLLCARTDGTLVQATEITTAWAVALGAGISLLCLLPLRWILSSFDVSRFAPHP